jgi:hypothetical protein
MTLTVQQSYGLLARFESYIGELCDGCGKGIGAIRFTRRGESGVWCSRGCRGDGDWRAIRKGGRPRKYETDADRQRAYRGRVLGVTKPTRSFAKTKDLQARKSPLSTIPLTRLYPALETAPNERQAGQ